MQTWEVFAEAVVSSSEKKRKARRWGGVEVGETLFQVFLSDFTSLADENYPECSPES